MVRYRLIVANAVVLLVLLGSFWGRRIEGATVAGTDFLRGVRVPFRGWKETEVKVPASEIALLQPDAVLARRYEAPAGPWAEITVIAGHRKRSVHTPSYCMVGQGWETLSKRESRIKVGKREITAVRSVMALGDQRLISTYFFTDGSYSTPNLVQFQGVQMLKHFRAQVPLGALVRILVPVGSRPQAAEQLSDEFAQATVPSVLDALSHAHLQVQ